MVQYIKRQLRSPFENNEATCAAHKTWNELKVDFVGSYLECTFN